MALTWVLTNQTKGTGASVQPGETKTLQVSLGDMFTMDILEATPNTNFRAERSDNLGVSWYTTITGRIDELGKYRQANIPLTDLAVDQVYTRVIVG